VKGLALDDAPEDGVTSMKPSSAPVMSCTTLRCSAWVGFKAPSTVTSRPGISNSPARSGRTGMTQRSMTELWTRRPTRWE
jgi:hypothetical protein